MSRFFRLRHSRLRDELDGLGADVSSALSKSIFVSSSVFRFSIFPNEEPVRS